MGKQASALCAPYYRCSFHPFNATTRVNEQSQPMRSRQLGSVDSLEDRLPQTTDGWLTDFNVLAQCCIMKFALY